MKRLYFLDNLRAFVVFLVIVLHGAITYMAYAPPWWYVLDPNNSLFFTALVILVDVSIMMVMFFVAGYFAYPSLVKRGSGQFIKDKFVRIGLPWIFGALLLAPPTAYMIYFSRGAPVTLAQFWAGDFWGVAYQQSVYWFLGILFLQFALLALAYAASERLRGLNRSAASPSWLFFTGFAALMTLAFLGMNQLYPPDTWTHVYLFVFQPLRLPLYFGYFILGLMAYQRGWFTEEGYTPGWGWVALFVVSGVLYLSYRFTIPTIMQTTLPLQAGNAILFNVYCLAGLMAGIAIFRRAVNGNGWFWASQARNSYGIYYVHPLILYPLAYLFVPLQLSVFVKAPLVILLGWLLSWGVSAVILTRLPGLRRIF
ncbi:MAG: acyltransferase family protein [Anaerolineae bacterium]